MSDLALPIPVRVGRRWYEGRGGNLYAPFVLVLYWRNLLWKRRLAVAPVGIYRLPREVGERVVSTWPAEFTGPLRAAREWALLTPDGKRVAGRANDFPALSGGLLMTSDSTGRRPDTMSITVTLTGA